MPPRGNTVAGMPTRDRLAGVIDAYVQKHGFSPTVRELAAELDLCASTVHHHLHALAREGRITWHPAQPRTIRPVAITEGTA